MAGQWDAHEVIYAVDIGYFQDTGREGLGDIRGLIERLEYLKGLGITCLWILPFYPSFNRDNGYDITEYKNVATDLGTLDDFRELVSEAHRHGLRILIDLVVHHTSNEHPWFQAARSDRDSPYRDYYVWSDSVPAGKQPESIFPGVEDSVWQYDDLAGAYYFHLFYHFQPDLNFANPRVQDEIIHIVEFWLSFGVDGFRIDAANHLFEEKGIPGTAVDDPCEFLLRLRDTMTRLNPEAVVLAEADVEPESVLEFTCEGDGIQLFLNFYMNNYVFHTLAEEQVPAIVQAIADLPQIPSRCSWVNFLRNLDEVDLERLEDDERNAVFRKFAPDESMRVYGRGIRRRLAPMLGGDPQRLKMAFSLLFALPGMPMLVYGDEIGMGDNLSLPEREAVRLPMQWTSGENGGFSTATSFEKIPSPMRDGTFGFPMANVKDEDADESSLLWFIRGALKVRQTLTELVEGSIHARSLSKGAVLALDYSSESSTLVTLHNVSSEPQEVELDLEPGRAVESVGIDHNVSIDASGNIKLGAYGFCWLRHA